MSQRNTLKVLVIGSGGREHTLAWALARSPQVAQVFVAPGNAGTEWPAVPAMAPSTNVPVADSDFPALIAFAKEHQIDLTVVGPEAPLALGIVDTFQANGLRVFGPSRQAAMLESSKVFAKSLMREKGIPTADFTAFDSYDAARAFVIALNRPVVIKADGLAAGKGVFVCDSVTEALVALQRILQEGEFGDAGTTVVVEERLAGPEVSVLAFTDGKTVLPMPPARDHKRVYDGNQGPNTGGMGAYAPVPEISAAMLGEICRTILQPVVDGMAARGTPYTGVLYAGLMLTANGPRVLEFNCRFGDPETQVILPLLESDLAEIMLACIEGRLNDARLRWSQGSCATVVLASPGYPGPYPKGLSISGLDTPPHDNRWVFHAGTAHQGDQVVTAGGRVLSVSATGIDLPAALDQAYAGIEGIHFEGKHYRRDIGRTALEAQQSAYTRAGVNIDAGQRTTALMAEAVKSTYGPEVLAGIGAFGGLYDAGRIKAMTAPVLVASTDGVGTKTKVAARLGRWETIGCDLVNHCINDILVQGATPLFFLDYVASACLNPEQVAAVVSGVAAACREVGCALIGGETAEMPGVYEAGEIDLAGSIVGIVERERIIDSTRIQPGDVILGLPSNGLHTNGYSLARRVLDPLDWTPPHPELGQPIGEVLLAVHRCYLDLVSRLWAAGITVQGLAHITGGGLIDNPPRIFPSGLGAILRRGTWPEPPIFGLIQRLGGVDDAEMCRVFNMGLGMLVIVPPEQAALAQSTLPGDCYVVGQVVDTFSGVKINQE